MKSGKLKIAFSSLCLVAALALAIFTVYAWFVENDKTKTNGIDTDITSGDVRNFEIDYYFATSEDGKAFTIGKKIDPKLANKMMEDFTPPIANETHTAMLLDFKLKFSKSGEYNLKAKTTHSGAYNDVNSNGIIDFDEYIQNNYLSNVVYFRHISESNIQPYVKFTVDSNATKYNFITNAEGEIVYFNGENDDAKKNTSVDLPSYTVAEGTADGREHHIYYVMDYMTLQIDSMYSIMLQRYPEKANLSTKIQFKQDIIIEIAKS